jgi:hypothetical protein
MNDVMVEAEDVVKRDPDVGGAGHAVVREAETVPA